MLGKKFLAVLLLVCTIITAIPLTALTAFADSVSARTLTNAMTSINSAFGSHRIGTTASLNDDGYIGIPVKYTIFYDRSNGPVESGYHGTPIIIYIVNANIERIVVTLIGNPVVIEFLRTKYQHRLIAVLVILAQG